LAGNPVRFEPPYGYQRVYRVVVRRYRPLAILLAIASSAGFGHDHLATWLFGAYVTGGLISMLTSYFYRQPSGIAFSIPGAIVIGPALNHLGFAEVVGASLVAGVVIAVLGLTGWVRKIMSLCRTTGTDDWEPEVQSKRERK